MHENTKECCQAKGANNASDNMQKHDHNHDHNHDHAHHHATDNQCKCSEGSACICKDNCQCHSKDSKNGVTSGSNSSHPGPGMMNGEEDEDPERSHSHHHGHEGHEHHHHHGHEHTHHHGHEGHDHHHHHEQKRGVIHKFSSMMGWSPASDHCHHHGHEGHVHTFDIKTWILVLATIIGAFTLYGMIFGLFLNGPLIQLFDTTASQATLGIISYFIMGIAFVKGSIITIRKKSIAEDTLVAIATTSAFLYSISVLFVNNYTDLQLPFFFNEMIEILWLIYLGRFIEQWLTNKVSREIDSLNELKPKDAEVIRDGKTLKLPASQIVIGDVIIVKPGQVIPVDGKVIEGKTTIDESSLTGESIPVNKEIGSQVFGGTISSNALIKIEATKLLDDSFISQIISSVAKSIETKPKSQRIADRIAAWLLPTVMVVAIISFFATGIIYGLPNVGLPKVFSHMSNLDSSSAYSSWIYAYYIFITVLVIACPCSFAMTTPMCVLASQQTSKKEKVLFASDSLFETIKSVDVICFDKTGTLTEGKFKVISSTIKKEFIDELVAIEKTSNHPLANSIVEHYKDVKTKDVKVKEVIGMGVQSSKLSVGSLKWLNESHPDYVEKPEIITKRKNGSAIVYAFNKETIVGYIELKDQIKSTTLKALSQIRKLGIDVVMITGDNRNTALNFASQLGISSRNVYAEVSPNEKSSIIEKLQKEGKVVSFVGDGINDSIALVQSDIGIAMGEGSDVAIESADIVLGEEDLTLVSYSIWLSRRTLYTIKRGFGIAITYNSIMVPMAALGILGLTGAGPTIAALSMAFNDTIAMVNAMTLTGESKKKFERKTKTKNK